MRAAHPGRCARLSAGTSSPSMDLYISPKKKICRKILLPFSPNTYFTKVHRSQKFKAIIEFKSKRQQ